MNYFNTWGEAVVTSFYNLWIKFINLLPIIIGALIILLVGLAIAASLGRLVKKLLSYTKVDNLIIKTTVIKRLGEAGYKFTISGIIGWIVKWFLIIVVLIAVADFLKWTRITDFLQEVALYIPNVIVAVIILVIGLIVGQFIHDVVEKGIKASGIIQSTAGALATVAKWAIVIFAVMASLIQLGIATKLIEILMTGLVAMLAIAFGLAFGLGGKEKASKWLDKMDQQLSRKKEE